jgi:phospholipid-binding lipoprotein MlaA
VRERLGSRFLALCLLLLFLGGCAASGDQDNDPFEPLNRHTQKGFLWLDDHVLHPVSGAYVGTLPAGLRRAIHNALANLGLPLVIVNDLLQGNPVRSAGALGRLAVNSTAGLGGLFDVASDAGLPPHEADFGQTFGVWGIGEGPYLFLPFFGPSNPRDALGTALSIAANPAMLLSGDEAAMMIGSELAMTAIDRRSERGALDRMRAESFDFYTTLREAYRQNRAYRIEQGKAGR